MGMIAVCGVMLMLISCGNPFFSEKEERSGERDTDSVQTETKEDVSLDEYREKMTQELVEILRQVDGVGDVQVMLTLKASNEKVTLKDRDDKGETNREQTVLIEDSQRNTSPYIIQEKEPEPEGVVVVCEGGENVTVKREITEAVSALFQIESHKIKVMKSKEAKE